eukprot:scaffold3155_cov97-Skeletonema_dohrnii-CCMP3373.AAC.7
MKSAQIVTQSMVAVRGDRSFNAVPVFPKQCQHMSRSAISLQRLFVEGEEGAEGFPWRKVMESFACLLFAVTYVTNTLALKTKDNIRFIEGLGGQRMERNRAETERSFSIYLKHHVDGTEPS